MVDHLDLAIGLYRNDGSGELRPEKLASNQRTFDEHNAFATYRAFITNHYAGVNAEGNREGFEKLKYTRDTGEDDSLFSDTGALLYWVLMKSATQEGRETWVLRKKVCDADPNNPDYDTADDSSDDSSDDDSDGGSGDGLLKRFGVPVGEGLNAYTYKAIYGAVEETMVFCPAYHERWIKVESERLASGKHYRDLHVGIGKEPTDDQKAAASALLADPDFQEGKNMITRGISWLGDFLVQVLIHESTHAEAFTGVGNALVDVLCRPPEKSTNQEPWHTTSLSCLRAVVRGDDIVIGERNQGHKDAEGFAMYAMGKLFLF
ncbi:hypothetical protein FSPOR_4889 [Fusarium sporotrichioides]|uniref:Uncharacterized protein n=1 Tax=Fusarium sporotrichioides TaxID=5514 RepID=A0A395S9T0_FUSSP|nr:hypothetical protein FSPOR_4889 [Fusarium sporotrichioides]